MNPVRSRGSFYRVSVFDRFSIVEFLQDVIIESEAQASYF